MEFYAQKYIEIYGLSDKREIEFEFPLPVINVESGETYTFGGSVDGADNENDSWSAVENKLTGSWNEEREMNLPLDRQVIGNVMGLAWAGHKSCNVM